MKNSDYFLISIALSSIHYLESLIEEENIDLDNLLENLIETAKKSHNLADLLFLEKSKEYMENNSKRVLKAYCEYSKSYFENKIQ